MASVIGKSQDIRWVQASKVAELAVLGMCETLIASLRIRLYLSLMSTLSGHSLVFVTKFQCLSSNVTINEKQLGNVQSKCSTSHSSEISLLTKLFNISVFQYYLKISHRETGFLYLMYWTHTSTVFTPCHCAIIFTPSTSKMYYSE